MERILISETTEPFVREDADCIGFYARRRTPAVWEWYCTDGSWHRTEADMPEKMLLPVGSSVKELYKEENSIYFVTQWKISMEFA